MAEFINSWNFLSMNYLWNTFSLFRVPFLIFAPAPKNVWVGPAFVAKCDGTLFDFVFFVLFHFLFADHGVGLWLCLEFSEWTIEFVECLIAWIIPWNLFGMMFVLDLTCLQGLWIILCLTLIGLANLFIFVGHSD